MTTTSIAIHALSVQLSQVAHCVPAALTATCARSGTISMQEAVLLVPPIAWLASAPLLAKIVARATIPPTQRALHVVLVPPLAAYPATRLGIAMNAPPTGTSITPLVLAQPAHILAVSARDPSAIIVK
jgi:hypothetical protein